MDEKVINPLQRLLHFPGIKHLNLFDTDSKVIERTVNEDGACKKVNYSIYFILENNISSEVQPPTSPSDQQVLFPDVAVANVGEPSSLTASNYFQPLEDTLLRLNQNPSLSDVENDFHPLELALLQVNQAPRSSSSSSPTPSPSPSPSSCSQSNENQVPPSSPPPSPPPSFQVHVQHGGGQADLHPRPSTSSSSSSSSSNIETGSRNRFNNLELRRVFTVPPPRNIPDLTQFYDDVMLILREMADAVRAQVGRNDVIQLELIGENVQNHVSVVVEDEHGDAILPAFEGLLERLVQSNAFF
ncbi:hypothetical protein PAMA_008874 [Pampus argenteus]